MSLPAPKHVTALIRRASDGDAGAHDELLGVIYAQLRRLAGRCFAAQPDGHTLQPTALVHEAYLKLMGSNEREWKDRDHFMAVAARAMRQVLTDHARAKQAQKRGGQWQKVTLTDVPWNANATVEVLALDELLESLARLNPRHASLVELRVFAGFGLAEIAEHLGVSVRTLNNDWKFVRAWIIRHLDGAT